MNRSELELTTMGKEASAEYVYNNVPLNDTILRMTKEAKLNPHQVARVCEAANIDTYNTLWDRTKSAEFVFDLADQEKIAEALNDTPDFNISENDVPVSQLGDLLPDVTEIDSPKTAEKTASYNDFDKAFKSLEKKASMSRKKFEKTAAHVQQFVDELSLAIEEQKLVKQAAFEKLTDMLKYAARNGENIADAYIAARIKFEDKPEEIHNIFSKIAAELSKSGISFKTAAKCIDENAKGSRNDDSYVISGTHPIIKYLNTIMDSDIMLDKADRMKGYFVSKIERAREHLHTHKFDNED